ncbi:hypothetical protein FBQ85_09765 [Cytophagia bacterium CHB2]|nr:hypothetical protein [Cytophagia bacterium CHB2]
MIYLAITIDTECDKGPQWLTQKPFKFDAVVRAIPEILQPLFERHNLKPTYLLSPEVILDHCSSDILGNLEGKVELGTHLHAEYVEPCPNWDTPATLDFQSQYSPEIERQKLENLTHLFRQTFGYSPRSFRAGRFGISQFTLSILNKLGYRIDSSVTPYLDWRSLSTQSVNFLGAPDQPYFPDLYDYRKEGTMQILEVPVTVLNYFWCRFPKAMLRRLNPLNRYQSFFMGKVIKASSYRSWFRPTYNDGDGMMSLADFLIQRKANDAPVVLNMMFHNVEFWPGTSPYAATEAKVKEYVSRIEQVVTYLLSKHEISSVGLSELYEVYFSSRLKKYR